MAVAIIGYVLYAGGAFRPSAPDAIDIDVSLPEAPRIPDAPKLPDTPLPTPK